MSHPPDELPPQEVAAPTPEASLGRRIAFKTVGGVASLPLNIALQFLVARALGAAQYGNFSFLAAFFTSVTGLADAGTSQAFYNRASQRPDEAALFGFYGRYVLAVLAIIGGLILMAFACGAAGDIWPGFSLGLVILAATMASGNWVITIVGKAVDAFALTSRGELANLVVRFVLVSTVALAAWRHQLDLRAFFSLQVLCNTLLVVVLVAIIAPRKSIRGATAPLDGDARRRYGREFWLFSHPLLVTTIATVLADIADRWLLQRFGGAQQQGYLGLGLQIATVVLIFGSSTAALLGREFARAYHVRDFDRLRADFHDHLPKAYFVTAYFGVFLANQASVIVRLFAGERFQMAGAATAIICLYPLHQVYGQVGNSLLYATDRGRLLRSIIWFNVLFGLSLTVFLVGPRAVGALDLGAVGFASKMVVHQIVIVNIVLFMNARFLGIPFLDLLGRQVITPVVLGALAWGTTFGIEHLVPPSLLSFLLSGVVYSLAVGLLVWRLPRAVGLPAQYTLALLAPLGRRLGFER